MAILPVLLPHCPRVPTPFAKMMTLLCIRCVPLEWRTPLLAMTVLVITFIPETPNILPILIRFADILPPTPLSTFLTVVPTPLTVLQTMEQASTLMFLRLVKCPVTGAASMPKLMTTLPRVVEVSTILSLETRFIVRRTMPIRTPLADSPTNELDKVLIDFRILFPIMRPNLRNLFKVTWRVTLLNDSAPAASTSRLCVSRTCPPVTLCVLRLDLTTRNELFVDGVLPSLRITIGLDGLIPPSCRHCLPNTVPIPLQHAFVTTTLFMPSALPDMRIAEIHF